MEDSMVTVVVILLVLLLVYYVCTRSEHMQPVYLDQMAMKYSDPTYFKYTGYQRDISGMSPRDYYLENQTNANNLAAPYYFAGDAAWADHTDYLDMPAQYRPKSAAALKYENAATGDLTPRSITSPVMDAEKESQKAENRATDYLSLLGKY